MLFLLFCSTLVSIVGAAPAGSIQQYIDANNLAANPTEIVRQYLYPNFPSETAIPTVTATELVSSCNHFASNLLSPPNNGSALAIQTVFAIERLIDFNDVGEVMTVMGIMFMHWDIIDCPLTVSNNFTTSQQLFIDNDNQVWQPKYLFTSSSDNIFMKGSDFGDELSGFVKVSNAENPMMVRFYLSRYGFFSSDCDLNIGKFPFDTQTCPISFAFQRSTDLLDFGEINVICPTEDFTEWAFQKCTSQQSVTKLSGSTVNKVTFEVTLVRKYMYYIVNSMLPSLCLSLLVISTFLLPPHQPDRSVFTVTILLALTVAMSDVLANIPKTSQRILLSDYILFLTFLTTGVALYHMTACCLSSIGSSKRFRERKTRIFNREFTFLRFLDIVLFLVSLAAFAGLHAYVGYVVTN